MFLSGDLGDQLRDDEADSKLLRLCPFCRTRHRRHSRLLYRGSPEETGPECPREGIRLGSVLSGGLDHLGWKGGNSYILGGGSRREAGPGTTLRLDQERISPCGICPCQAVSFRRAAYHARFPHGSGAGPGTCHGGHSPGVRLPRRSQGGSLHVPRTCIRIRLRHGQFLSRDCLRQGRARSREEPNGSSALLLHRFRTGRGRGAVSGSKAVQRARR
mmetsp:Transcript_11794/g.24888  ORF Transcript_11794/g.24888 Transcript_11794/m.24888 type:complete len:216 (+) Transcript_11794:563-1210(+)